MERKQWLATRKTGIGGSDAAAILGMSPWKSQMDVWLDKKGMTEERPDPDKEFLLDLGLRLEPIIAELYERETKTNTVYPNPLLWRHEKWPVLLATPDRFVMLPEHVRPARGLELKTENQFSDQFGDPGTDEVPHHYFIQCAHYMMVCGLPSWDLAVLHGGVKFSVYQLQRDEELEQAMAEQLLAWWEKHIIGNVPPDVDSSDAWRIYLHKKHPMELLPIEKIEPEMLPVVERLSQVRQAERILDAVRDELENKIKSVIADREGVLTPYGKITWKKTKDSSTVDWEGLSMSIARKYGMHEDMFGQLKSIHTGVRPGVRRFLFTQSKESKHGNNPKQIAGAAFAALADPDTGNGEHSVSGTGKSTDRS